MQNNNRNPSRIGERIWHNVGQSNHIETYSIQKQLGLGGFAEVYLIKSADSGEYYACKFIDKSQIKSKKHFEKLKSEIQLHSLCGGGNAKEGNKNIVQFFRYFENQQTLYLMIGYCRHGCLQSLLKKRKKLTEYETKFIMYQTCEGVQYLHREYNIIHRDLKLANVLLDSDMNVKICDFGLAAKLERSEERKTTICGTPNYIAPEIALGIGGNKKDYNGHSFEVDIWSIGIMTFTLIFGQPPFQTKSMSDTLDKIKKCQFAFPSTSLISQYGKDLMRRILQVKPEKRLNLKKILSHAFFQKRVPAKLPTIILEREPTKQELFPHNYMDVRDEESVSLSFCASNSKNNKKLNHLCVNVIKYIDYSNKYGIGYILSNGCTGIFFNDTSSFILPISKKFLCYIDINGEKIEYNYKQFASGKCTDMQLNKKFLIFMQIAKMVWSDFSINSDNIRSRKNKIDTINDIVYIQKNKPTQYARILKLSNDIIQTTFTDTTVVLIIPEHDADTDTSASKFIFIQQKTDKFEMYDSYPIFKGNASKSTKLYVQHIQKSIVRNAQ